MSSTGFGTCSKARRRPHCFQRTGSARHGAEPIDVTAGHGLTAADAWPPGLVFLPVEAERLGIGSGHCPFRVILPFQPPEQGKHTLAPVDIIKRLRLSNKVRY
jgi:hypothetical protein